MSSAPGLAATDWLAAYPPPRSLSLDQDALRVYEQAYYLGVLIHEKAGGLPGEPEEDAEDSPPITFTTLAAALLLGDDDTCRWFAKMAEELGPDREGVLAEKGITADVLHRLARRRGWPPAAPIRLSSDKQLLTSSSRAVLETAENWAQRVGGSDIGVRHLIAAYVVNPPAHHRQQLRQWHVSTDRWRSAFFTWMAARFTWEEWIDASQRAAPEANRVAFEQTKVKGRSLAWPGNEQARRILSEAATWHRHRGDDAWLRSATVLFALVQSAELDPAVRADVQPIWDAVQQRQPQYLHALNRYFDGDASRPRVDFDDLDISPRVLNALETARELAAAASPRHEATRNILVSPLHLAGALLSTRVDAVDDMAALGLDVPVLREALVTHAEGREESAEVWREMLGQEEVLLTGRPVDLNSDEPEAVVRRDEPWTNDPLAIRPDVEAFAALLAARSLEPPLSIGLFGPWGSGKTTFLKRLRRAVQRHADEARTRGDSHGPYVPNIVHVEFNAWHFAEEALVSSLVDATVREISAFVKADPARAPREWLDEKLAELESRRRQLAAATEIQAAATTAVEKAQATLTVREHDAALRAASLKAAIRSVWTAAKREIAGSADVKDSGVIDALGTSVQDLADLRERVDHLRARPGRLFADLGWARTVCFAVLVLVVPPVVATLVARLLGVLDVRAFLSSVSALLALVSVWAKFASDAVRRMDAAAASVVVEYEKHIAGDEAVTAAQAALTTAHVEAQAAAATLQASRDALARARADAANASLPAQTLQLVSARIDERSYAKELTTLSLARADLEALSRILRAQRTDSGEANAHLRPVDRVVLYIDDLDRCRPEDVVRVLQIVHMLLAFELFVVVVAVDARWVEQALRESYPWLSRSASTPAASNPDEEGPSRTPVEPFDHVTAEDYLEKIFQIAFWLEPMTAGRAASYLTSLVRPPGATGSAPPPPADGASPAAPKVDISSVELDYMRALAAYVGSSPRRVKRLVNAYRLIKARLSDAQLNAFVTDSRTPDGQARSGPYQIVIGLLVIGTGTQSASRAILGALGEWDPRATYDQVVAAFRNRADPDWTVAAQVIETIMRTQKATNVSELRGWARKVRRFLLHGPRSERRRTPPVQPPPPNVLPPGV